MTPQAELCLFLAARSEHIDKAIGPALEEGKIVLCDRFNDSSVSYQGAARGLGIGKVTEFCQFISQGIKPNLTLYLDIPPAIGLARAKARQHHDRIEAETLEFHSRIRQAYLQIHRAEPQRFHLIDAQESIATVYEHAMRLIHQHV